MAALHGLKVAFFGASPPHPLAYPGPATCERIVLYSMNGGVLYLVPCNFVWAMLGSLLHMTQVIASGQSVALV